MDENVLTDLRKTPSKPAHNGGRASTRCWVRSRQSSCRASNDCGGVLVRRLAC
jgi:hypothetical protein